MTLQEGPKKEVHRYQLLNMLEFSRYGSGKNVFFPNYRNRFFWRERLHIVCAGVVDVSLRCWRMESFLLLVDFLSSGGLMVSMLSLS